MPGAGEGGRGYPEAPEGMDLSQICGETCWCYGRCGDCGDGLMLGGKNIGRTVCTELSKFPGVEGPASSNQVTLPFSHQSPDLTGKNWAQPKNWSAPFSQNVHLAKEVM